MLEVNTIIMLILFIELGLIIRISMNIHALFFKRNKNGEGRVDTNIKGGALYPKVIQDSRYSKLHENFRKVLNDKNITNVGVTGEYGTGKTTFLKTFFNEDNKLDYKFVPVPSFTKSNDDKENLSIELEKNIINHLIDKSFPNSGIRKAGNISHEKVNVQYLMCWMVIILVEGIWLLNSLDFQKAIDKKNIILVNFAYLLNIILFVVLKPLFKKILYHVGKVTLNVNTAVGSLQLNTEEKENITPPFIAYKEEISKYIKNTGLKYIIFEDIDRYNNLEIFQNLRDLNKNINESYRFRDRKVAFIYTFKDTIFDERNGENLPDENSIAKIKVKFFDYILSLPPFANINLGYDLFRKELAEYNGEFSISPEKLIGLGLLVNDKREVISIVADMYSYKKTIVKENFKGTTKSNDDKLLGAMVYKNLYPTDFYALYSGQSELGKFLKDIQTKDIKDEFNSYINESNDNSKEYKFFAENQVLKYLILHGLIDETFWDYVFPNGNMAHELLVNAVTHKLGKEDIEVSNPEEVMKQLDELEKDDKDIYKYIYSSTFLEYLMKEYIKRGDKQYKAKIESILENFDSIWNHSKGELQEEQIAVIYFLNKVISWGAEEFFKVDKITILMKKEKDLLLC